MTIRSKILGILAVPFVGFLGLISLQLQQDLSTWQAAQSEVSLVRAATLSSNLVHHLQLERGMSSGFLGSSGRQFGPELTAQRLQTDGAATALSAVVGARPELADLLSFRSQIDSLGLTATHSFQFYTSAIASLMEEIGVSVQVTSDPLLIRATMAYTFFLTQKEFTGQLRATLNGALTSGKIDAAALQRVHTILSAIAQAEGNFQRFSPPALKVTVTTLLQDVQVAAADRAVAAVLASPSSGPFPLGAPALFSLITAKIETMKKAEDSLAVALLTGARGAVEASLAAVIFDASVASLLVLLALILAFRLTSSIRSQLGCEPGEVADVARNIAKGILDLPPSKRRAVGAFEDLRTMVEALRSKADALELIAQGDLTGDLNLASEGDRLGSSLREMVGQLRDLIQQIQSSAEQMISGADQVAQASQSLAQGATQQAAAVEEISASSIEVASKAQANARTAETAVQAAQAALLSAQQGSQKMGELLGLVTQMMATSKETQRIVKTIDDISFQVNLLSLNANVEAARAGKYGKGFGVVANEVRALAVRSAAAVAETSTMVSNTLKAIAAVDVTAQRTSVSLEEISQGAQKVASVLAEISASSLEQAHALGEVRGGLDQIDRVTQSNTASAEQSASAAEQLSGQAGELGRLVGRFRLT